MSGLLPTSNYATLNTWKGVIGYGILLRATMFSSLAYKTHMLNSEYRNYRARSTAIRQPAEHDTISNDILDHARHIIDSF